MAWLYQRPGSGNWMLGFRINGKLVQRSTRTADADQAKQQLAGIEAVQSHHRAGLPIDALFAALKNEGRPPVTLLAEVGDWLAEVKTSTAPTTAKVYASVTTDFLEFLGATGTKPLLREVTADSVRLFLGRLRGIQAASTVNHRLKVLRVMFGRATREGRLLVNPAASVKGVRVSARDAKIRRPFTAEEVGVILRHADDFWKYATLVGFYTGLRLGDIATMPAGAVDLGENVIRLATSKTDARLVLPLAVPLRAVLVPLVKGKRPTDDLWPVEAAQYRESGANALSSDFHALLVTCGLVTARDYKLDRKNGVDRGGRRTAHGVSFHSLRHSFVSLLKATGSSAAVAKSLAGHASDRMSDHYTSLPLETLRAAVAALPEVLP